MVLVDDVEAFVEQLVVLGRSSYTLRSYQLGVEHFRRWLRPRSLDEVTRSVVAEYVADFAAGPGRVAGEARAPRTVNHRVAALAAFFGFLIERDTRRCCWSLARSGEPGANRCWWAESRDAGAGSATPEPTGDAAK